MITPDFLITSLIVVLIPGTGVLFTVATGLAWGRRGSFFAALGCTLGIVPHMLAAILGLAAVLHASATAFQALKLAGAAYLLYLAYATWRQGDLLAVEAGREEAGVGDGVRGRGLVLKAILVNILNPKLSIFFLAFLPQFVPGDAAAPLAGMLLLGGVFMAMTFAVFLLYGLLADLFRRRVAEAPRVRAWLRYGFASAFAGLGVKLAMAER